MKIVDVDVGLVVVLVMELILHQHLSGNILVGGGGGYFGGGGAHDSGGGGGSGYINTSKLITNSTGMKNGQHSGNGQAKVTLVIE